MASQSKTQLLNEVYTLLKKRYKLEPRAQKLSVLEAIIYGICHEGTTRDDAEQALNRFRDQFFDWNEVRVSSIEEIQGVFAGQANAEERANRLRRFLRQLFEKTYEFALDTLVKKPLKESVKLLSQYDAFHSDYVLATAIQQGLGGHAMPVDEPIRRGLSRLSIVEPNAETEAIRSLLERAIPKNRGSEFVDLVEELTHDVCVAGVPDCPRCDLRKICPTGLARAATDKAGIRPGGKGKPSAPAPAPPAPPEKSAKGAKGSKAAAPTKATPSKSAPAPAAAAKGTKHAAPPAASKKSVPEKPKVSKPEPKAAKVVKATKAGPAAKAAKGRKSK